MDRRRAKSDLVAAALDVFRDDAASVPPLTLRGACDIDSNRDPEPFDGLIDIATDDYIERSAFCGVPHLDARSWRHYLPRLIEYALSHPTDPAMAAEALVRSLRPPDRYPPRLGSLSADQERVVTSVLEHVAVGDVLPGLQEEAQQALEEWWLPNPRCRPTAQQIAAARAEPAVYRTIAREGYRLSLPETLTGSDPRDIPSESRRVEVWGGYVCYDADTTVAVNVKPLRPRALESAIGLYAQRLRPEPLRRAIRVPGAREAVRFDGSIGPGDPGEAQTLTLIFTVGSTALTLLSIRYWPRDDVRAVVERIASSFEIS